MLYGDTCNRYDCCIKMHKRVKNFKFYATLFWATLYCRYQVSIDTNYKTRKLCYRKDDRAMRPISLHGCPENFRVFLSTPTATIPNIFHGLLFGSTL